jgi:hypothetical protein
LEVIGSEEVCKALMNTMTHVSMCKIRFNLQY